MSSPRKVIRAAAKCVLENRTIAGANVRTNRPNPLPHSPSALNSEKSLPCIVIYTPSIKSEVFDESPRRYRHEAELVVEGLLEVTGEMEEIDDELDALENEILVAMLRDDTLGGTCDDLKLVGSVLHIEADGEKPLGAVAVTFTVSYYTFLGGLPAEEMDDLQRIRIEYDLASQQPNPADRAVTDITDLEEDRP